MLRQMARLKRWSTPRLIVFGLGLIAVLFVVDTLTGSELSLSIFYLIPVSVVAWLAGKREGYAISVVAALAWLAADLLGGHTYSHATIPFWNAAVRLGFFLIVAHTLAELNQSRRRQEELTHFIVHDLRSPLGIVMTGLETLDLISEGNLSAKQVEIIKICMTSSSRMLTLINSILDLARLESGQMPLQPANVEVAAVVRASIDALALWADQKNVSLSADLASDVTTVYADAAVTERVLINLLSNAIKFSPRGTEVSVRVAPHDHSLIAFSVRDQGKGIPGEWVDKVFDKFAQADVKSHGGRVGTGLGLSFSRLAIEAQGGAIWIDSKLNQGTVITFTLPRVDLNDRVSG